MSDRILRGVIQIGGHPTQEDCQWGWLKLQEHPLEFHSEEDQKIYKYLEEFYQQMSAPPDYTLIKEYFENLDDIETVTKLEEIKATQCYIRTNYLSIIRAELNHQQVKGIILLCRDASAIAEHGRNLDKPVDGKKVLRGVHDAVNYLYGQLHQFTRIEGGEKLEGIVTDDDDEFLGEYELTEKINQFANRNLFGFEPVDSVCRGHRIGEFWVHAAFAGHLKCLAGSAIIYDHKAQRLRTLEETYESGDLPEVTSLYREGEQHKLIPAKTSHLVQNGIRPVYEIELSSGRRTIATYNHRFLTIDGWKELSNIKPGDWVAVPKQIRVSDPNRQFSDEKIQAIGYLLGDGCVAKAISLTVRENQDRASNVRISANSGTKYHKQISPIRLLLDDLGLHSLTTEDKFIPYSFYGLSKHQTALLLGALWSTDGSVDFGDYDSNDRDSEKQLNSIRYYSKSKQLCMGVQSLLLRLGINSRVIDYKAKHRDFDTYYMTYIVGNHAKRVFCDHVRIVGKDHVLDRMIERLPDTNDTSYPVNLIPDDASAIIGTAGRRYASQIKRNGKTVSAHVLKYFTHIPAIKQNLEGDILWEQVKSITYKGKEMTYDLGVPEHHSFIVNDIITHNTTVALNYAYNNVVVYGKNIFYAILEMPYSQLRRQLYVIHSSHGKFVTRWYNEDGYVGLDYRQVRDGELSARDKERLRIVSRDFHKSTKGRLYVWRPNEEVTIDKIRRKAEMFHNKEGCDGIIIDHLGLVQPRRASRDYVIAINSVVREARMLALNFARGHAIPLLALFQINRQGLLRAEKNEGRYDFAAISYANEIEKSADVITTTYLDDQLRKEGKFKMGNLKNRDNPHFDMMIGKIIWKTKRMRAIEPHLIDLNNSQLLNACDQITMEDVYSNIA